jgi:hypothetical protein
VLTIHDSVTIAVSVAAPFTCETLTGDGATCGKMPVRTIKDYVARYYTDPIVRF